MGTRQKEVQFSCSIARDCSVTGYIHHKTLIKNFHFKDSEGYLGGSLGTSIFSDMSRNYSNFVKAGLLSVEFSGTKLLLVYCS